MRIALLYSNPCIGGAETFGLAAAARWSKRHDVAIVNLWNGGGLLKEASRVAGVRFIAIDGGARWFRPSAAWKLRSALAAETPDIVCVFGFRLQLLTRILRSYLTPAAIWVTMLRGEDAWRNRAHVLADRWTQHRFACHVGCSRAICGLWAAREQYPVNRLVFIPNGIDLSRFSPSRSSSPLRRELGLPESGLLCVTIANMRPVKGYDFLVDSLAKNAQRFGALDISFLWVGGHHGQWELLRQRLRDAGLNERVIAPGCVADVRPYLAASDLCVLPSQSEGMPRALMEAMAMGLPVVATNVGGIPDVVRDGRDGLLVPYGDQESLASAICSLAADRARLRRMGESARERIAASFDIEAVADEYTRLFEFLRDCALSDVDARLNRYRSISRYNPLPEVYCPCASSTL
jgi:glycosyltransferase involved in cell wall biosynthesis